MTTPSLSLRRVQAASGLVFFLFASLHLLNTALGALGPDACNGFQRSLRRVYQHPALELGLVLAPLVVHVAASVACMRGRPRSVGRSFRQRVGLPARQALRVLCAAGSTPPVWRWAPLLLWPEYPG